MVSTGHAAILSNLACFTRLWTQHRTGVYPLDMAQVCIHRSRTFVRLAYSLQTVKLSENTGPLRRTHQGLSAVQVGHPINSFTATRLQDGLYLL